MLLRGQPDEFNLDANFLTESNELRSNSMISSLAEGMSLSIVSLTSLAATIFLTPIITCMNTVQSKDTSSLSANAVGCSCYHNVHMITLKYSHHKNYLLRIQCSGSITILDLAKNCCQIQLIWLWLQLRQFFCHCGHNYSQTPFSKTSL